MKQQVFIIWNTLHNDIGGTRWVGEVIFLPIYLKVLPTLPRFESLYMCFCTSRSSIIP